MDYFPIFIHTRDRKVVFVGGAEDIGHKLILLGKSSAHRHVYGDISDPRVSAMITSGEVTHHAHALLAGFDAVAIPADLAVRMPENEWIEAAAHALPSYQQRFLHG